MRTLPLLALVLVACGGSGSESPPPVEPVLSPQVGAAPQTIRRSELDPTEDPTVEPSAPAPTSSPTRGRRRSPSGR